MTYSLLSAKLKFSDACKITSTCSAMPGGAMYACEDLLWRDYWCGGKSSR